jgi:tRNA dimethylallyltransferase
MHYATLAICGPTASGKTALSLEIAHEIAGEVVNVDSVQVYKDLHIGAAKLPESERRGIPHHVMDIVSPEHGANVAQFREVASAAIKDISGRGKMPILVGGSGLYLTALLHGLADMPPQDAVIRAGLERLGSQERYEQLLRVDPETAGRLSPNDSVRVTRALEVYYVSGVAQSTWHTKHQFSGSEIASLVIVPCLPREDLYERINIRSEKMVAEGLLEETRTLISHYGHAPVLSTLGYRQAVACIEGRLPQAKLAEEIALHTRRFAKRQMTYWRNEPAKRGWRVRPAEDEISVALPGPASKKRTRKADTIKTFQVMRFSTAELVGEIKKRLREGLSETEVWYVWLQ